MPLRGTISGMKITLLPFLVVIFRVDNNMAWQWPVCVDGLRRLILIIVFPLSCAVVPRTLALRPQSHINSFGV
jgi:hypothetical protein